MKYFIVLIFISLTFASANAIEQSVLSGRITVDQNPVPNAVVSLYLLDQKQERYTKNLFSKTSDTGQYQFDSLQPGNYILIIKRNNKRIYQGEISLTKSRLVKDIELTAFIFNGNWKLNLAKSILPASYEMIDSTRTYSKKGDLIKVQWSQSFKNGNKTVQSYEFKCNGEKWVTGGQTIMCNYNFDGSIAVVEGEKSPPHQYFRNELQNNVLIISTYKDRQHKQLISKSVFDPVK